MSALGKRIRTLRQEREMSQKELASLVDVHQTAISFIERGDRRVSLELACKLAQTFDVTVNDLILAGAELESERHPA